MLFLCILPLLFGLAGSFAFPPYNAFYMGLASYALLFVSIETFGGNKKQVFSISLSWGLGFHVGGLWWIAEALMVDGNPYKWAYPLAVLGLPFLLSLYIFVCCLFYKKISEEFSMSTGVKALLFAVLLSATEWLRGHAFTGFPWNLPAYIWSEQLEILQGLSWMGAYGLSSLTLFLAIMLGANFLKKSYFTMLLSVLLLGVFCWLYLQGQERLQQAPLRQERDFLVRIVQPNIPQADKWNEALYIDHLNVFYELSTRAVPEGTKKVLLVFPETALNGVMLSKPEASQILSRLAQFYREQGIELYLLSGVLQSFRRNGQIDFYNSALIYDSDGQIADDYNKSHLVPFGEYMPLSNIVDVAPIVGFSGFSKGDGAKTVSLPELPSFGIAICYEIIFPKEFIDSFNRPDFVVTITNDAWYGDTPGPYQHYMMARYRAIEENIPVYRSANTGVSGGFDAYGRELSVFPLAARGIVDIK